MFMKIMTSLDQVNNALSTIICRYEPSVEHSDSDVPAAIESEVKVEESLHPLHLKMEKMVFSTENS